MSRIGLSTNSIEEFHYRVPWLLRTIRPGIHRSAQQGSGYELSAFRPFGQGVDPRRFDLRASVRDPLQRIMVRQYKQLGSVDLVVLADISASMDFQGVANKKSTLTAILSASAVSAYRSGDRFSFLAADEKVREDCTIIQSRQLPQAMAISDLLGRTPFSGKHARGLLDAVPFLPRKKSLILLVSDFHLPLEFIRQLLSALARHFVIPMVLRDSKEALHSKKTVLLELSDNESGQRRLLMLRPSLQRKIQELQHKRRKALNGLFAQYALRPLAVYDGFDAQVVTRYFLED